MTVRAERNRRHYYLLGEPARDVVGYRGGQARTEASADRRETSQKGNNSTAGDYQERRQICQHRCRLHSRKGFAGRIDANAR